MDFAEYEEEPGAVLSDNKGRAECWLPPVICQVSAECSFCATHCARGQGTSGDQKNIPSPLGLSLACVGVTGR